MFAFMEPGKEQRWWLGFPVYRAVSWLQFEVFSCLVMCESYDFRIKLVLYFSADRLTTLLRTEGFPPFKLFLSHSFPNLLPLQIPDSVGECHVKLFLTDWRITVAGTKDIDGGEQSQGALRRKRWNSD